MCKDREYFDNYPWPISYVYNSRGFRDAEWPRDLNDVIWCMGDSFTVGLGAPFLHIWPQRLSAETGRRTINVSMDGASNSWIGRRAIQILDLGIVDTMIIQWSYTQRRENFDNAEIVNLKWQTLYNDIKDPLWPVCPRWQDQDELPAQILAKIQQNPRYQLVTQISDEDRRLWIPKDRRAIVDDRINTRDFLDHVQQVESHKKNACVIHTFIPGFSRDRDLYKEIKSWPAQRLWLPEIKRLDWARDQHHYDIVTSDKLSKDLKKLLDSVQQYNN